LLAMMVAGPSGLLEPQTQRALLHPSSPADADARLAWIGMGVAGLALVAVAAWVWASHRRVTSTSALCWLVAAAAAFVTEYQLAFEAMHGDPTNVAGWGSRAVMLVLLVAAGIATMRKPVAEG
jgi:hypothetical protein